MKKFNSVMLILALGVASILAQGITPIPNGPSVTTPTPTPAGYPLEAGAAAIVESHHYSVNLAEINSISSTSGNVALFTFPLTRYAGVNSTTGALWIIDKVVIRPTTPISGGGITDATAQVRAANNYGSAQHVFTGATTTIPYVVTTSGNIESGNAVVNLVLTSSGGNLSAATAGQIDVYITYHVL